MNSRTRGSSNRIKWIVVGGLLAAAVIFMVLSVTRSTAEFFLTVSELQTHPTSLVGENVRVSGAVIGDTITYDQQTGLLHFVIADIPADLAEVEAQGGIAAVLHEAAQDPTVPRLAVTYAGAPPDMLKDEAQAILTGTVLPDGSFRAEELLLKCPSKYEEAVPDQVD